MSFPHERFDVYQLAIDYVALTDNIIEKFPKGRSYLANQLLRASASIPLNIAEGAGKYSKGDKKRYYSIAQGSATECAAIFDVCERLKIVELEPYQKGKQELGRIASMLTNLIKSIP